MKKRLFSLLLAVVMVVSILPFTAFATDGTWAGKGTEAEPYEIADVADLKQLAKEVNTNHNEFSGKFFVMTNDITFTADDCASYSCIGFNQDDPFRGIFDGAGYTIYNFVPTSFKNYMGLFGYNAGTIKNLNFVGAGLDNTNTKTNPYGSAPIRFGVCAATNMDNGKILNVNSTSEIKFATGTSSSTYYIGGLVGFSSGLIDGCSNKGSITCTKITWPAQSINGSEKLVVGGISGGQTQTETDKDIGITRNSYNTADLSTTVGTIGGIIGHNYGLSNTNPSQNVPSSMRGLIENCYNWGDVAGGQSGNVGGIVGKNSSVVRNCYNAGLVTGGSRTGGAFGEATPWESSNCGAIVGTHEDLFGDNTGYPDGVRTGSKFVDNNDTAKDAYSDELNDWVDNRTTPDLYKHWFFEEGDPGPKFDPNTYYTLAYETDGGTISDDAAYTKEGKVASGAVIDTPTAEEITKTDSKFLGWFSDSALTAAAPATMPEADLTLYAKWVAEMDYTIEYYFENAAGEFVKDESKTETPFGYEGDTVEVTTPKAFDGYGFDSGNTNNVLSDILAATRGTVLKLYYKLNRYTVTYKSAANTTLTADAVTSGLLTGADIPEAPAVTANDGYRLGSWTLKSGTVGADGKVGNTDLVYEIAAIKQYTVTYTDGVEKAEIFADQSTTVDSGASTPAFVGTPNRFGYKFTGWSPAVAETVTADVTYTAQWQRIVFNTPAPSVIVTGLNTTDHVAYVIGRGNDMFVPGANVTRAEAATMFFRLMTDEYRTLYWDDECSYSDVKADAWYNVAIATLENAGAIDDTAAGGKFRPNDPVTRAELAVMAAQFCTTTGTIPGASFLDVTPSHWAYREISVVQFANWIEGYNGKFRPDDNLTRAECVSIINRILQRGAESEDMLEDMVTFKDNMNTAMWYYEAIQEAANSHDYSRTGKILTGEHFVAEKWTALKKAPDWAALEKAWAEVAKK